MLLKVTLLCVFGCSVTLATSVYLGGVLSGNRMAGAPLGRSLGDGELDVEGICAEPGMTCLNCTHSVTCVSLPFGYLKVPLQVCSNGETCNAHEGGCSKKAVPECEAATEKYKHTCEQNHQVTLDGAIITKEEEEEVIFNTPGFYMWGAYF